MDNVKNDKVMVSLSGKKVGQEYVKCYMYSLRSKKHLEPRKTDRSESGDYWDELYFLLPGKYLIIEVNIDNTKHNCRCRRLTIFTRYEYLSDKRQKYPDAKIREFNKTYHYAGSEIDEWKGYVPYWVEPPCECLLHLKRMYGTLPEVEVEVGEECGEEKGEKENEYKQPQEVEDKLSVLLPRDSDDDSRQKTDAQYLIRKHKKSDLKLKGSI